MELSGLLHKLGKEIRGEDLRNTFLSDLHPAPSEIPGPARSKIFPDLEITKSTNEHRKSASSPTLLELHFL